jgi:hypothetical protein
MSKDPWEKWVRAAHNTINSTKNKTVVEAQHTGLSSSQRSTELSSHFLQFICGTPELQLARPWLTGTLGPWDLGSKPVACRGTSCRLSSIGPHLGSSPTAWQWGLLFVCFKKISKKMFFFHALLWYSDIRSEIIQIVAWWFSTPQLHIFMKIHFTILRNWP